MVRVERGSGGRVNGRPSPGYVEGATVERDRRQRHGLVHHQELTQGW